MKLIVNGKEQNYSEETLSISELLIKEKVEMPDQVSVQMDGNFVDRKEYGTTRPKDGSSVDFLYFLGGGFR